MANDVKSMPSGITSPPTIESSRMERLRHRETTNGIVSIEMDQLSAPSSSAGEEEEKEMGVSVCILQN